MTRLKIPNEEVRDIFQNSVVEWFNDRSANSDRQLLFQALWNEDADKLSELLSDLLFNTISYHDYAESYYHAFLTGLFSSAGYIVESHFIKSNVWFSWNQQSRDSDILPIQMISAIIDICDKGGSVSTVYEKKENASNRN